MSTTALYKALIEAHVSEDTAERAVEGLAYAREVATKTDLAELKTELKQDISELRAELKQDIGELRVEFKQDIGELRAELKQDIGELRVELKQDIGEVKGGIAALETKMLRWSITMTGVVIGAVALIITVFGLIVKL